MHSISDFDVVTVSYDAPRQGVPESVGFDIEVKMTTPDDLAATPAAEVERMVSATLAMVRPRALTARCRPRSVRQWHWHLLRQWH